MCTLYYCEGGGRCESVGCYVSFFDNGGKFVNKSGECSVGSFGGGGRAGLLNMGGGVCSGFR